MDQHSRTSVVIRWMGVFYRVSDIKISDGQVTYSVTPRNQLFENALVNNILSKYPPALNAYLSMLDYTWLSDDDKRGEA